MGFIRVYNGTRYLVLFGLEKYDALPNRIRYLIYLISLKSSITYVFSHHYSKIKVDPYDSLPMKKTLTCYNIVIML